MKKSIDFILTTVGLVAVVGLLAVLALAWPELSARNTASVPIGTQVASGYPATGYPPPQDTLPPPAPSHEATQRAEATASAPAPSQTPTPIPEGGGVLYDSSGQFRLMLLPGWWASTVGNTVITNYDTEQLSDVHSFPPGGLKIQIGIGKLSPEQSFEQWQADWIALETTPTDDWLGQTATELVPYTLGNYEGFSYFLNGEPRTFEIHLPLSDRRVISAQLTPADSSALEEALSMLATLEVLSENTP